MLYFPPIEDDTPPLGAASRNDPIERSRIHGQGSATRAPEVQSQSLKDEVEGQRAIIAQKDAELQRLTNAYESLKSLHEEKCDLLEHRTTKLRAAEKLLLMQEDEVSAGEIEGALEHINSQIITIAGTCSNLEFLPEGFKPEIPKRNRGRPAELTDDMVNNLGSFVGEKILTALVRLNYVKNNSAVLRISMQAIVCFFVQRVCDVYPYSPTRKANAGKGLWDIYSEIHANEVQAVAAQWRSTSCKYSKGSGKLDDLLKEMTFCTIQYFSRVLLMAGVHPDLSKLHRYCEHCVGDSLRALWSVVFQFAEKLKERVFSTDYTIVSDFPGTKYDPSMMKMRGSVLDENENFSEGTVSCTIQLGLRRNTSLANPGESAKGRVTRDIVKKSVVFLDQELSLGKQ